MINYHECLQNMAMHLGVQNVYDQLLLDYPQFKRWAGSHKENLHHYGEGGLIRHTWEIVEIGMHTFSMDSLDLAEKLDPVEFYLAALFHDTGKMYDYAELPSSNGKEWLALDHKRLIYHLPRSVLIWHDTIAKFPVLNAKYHDAVMHDILAHHGQREYGSPVAPKTHAAWLLYLSDSISARMDDCDRLDVVANPNHK